MTRHEFITADSICLQYIPDESIDLIVTSPPYPMIEMWDECFIGMNESIRDDFNNRRIQSAFNKMHSCLNNIWRECNRVLKKSGFICINIGDATRTFDSNFQLFCNHSKVIEYMSTLGYMQMPPIIWHKPSNSPNKFMGSGMYPAGAYVTLEHEYILIFRNGGKRDFTEHEKHMRRESAYFYEERNKWFQDVWKINGTQQIIRQSNTRGRNASYPFEIPYRLINMYSIKGDTVLDVFGGLGTTAIAAMSAERNSISIDIDSAITDMAKERACSAKEQINTYINNRLIAHNTFIHGIGAEKLNSFYDNVYHGTKVKTKQEVDLRINFMDSIAIDTADGSLLCEYTKENPNRPKGLF